MSKASLLIAAVAAVGLAACTNDAEMAAHRAGLVPLVDQSGLIQAWIPESEARGARPGTPFTINRNGQIETLTLGVRPAGVSAGTVRVVGIDGGRPMLERVDGTASGSLAPTGTAVMTGVDGTRPSLERVDPSTQVMSRRQRLAAEREAQRAAAAAAANPGAAPAAAAPAAR